MYCVSNYLCSVNKNGEKKEQMSTLNPATLIIRIDSQYLHMTPDIDPCLLTFIEFSVGHHSGSLNGVQYFSCPPNYGAFVRIDDVLCITSRGVSDHFTLYTPIRSALCSMRNPTV